MTEQPHVTESAGAYVLGALGPDEAREVEAHAQKCEACRQDIHNLRQVAGVLPLSAPVVEPPANLKTTILNAAQGDERAHQVLRRAAQRGSDPGARHGFWRKPVSFWAGVAGWVGVAAACIIMGIFIGVADERQRMLASLQQPRALGRITAAESAQNAAAPEAAYKVFPVSADQLQSEAIALIGQAQVFDLSVRHSGDHIPAKIMQMPHENKAVLVSDMPRAPTGQVYRVWLIRRGKMHLGRVVMPGKMVKTMIPMKVEMGDVIAFSMSPVGDKAAPNHFMMQQTL